MAKQSILQVIESNPAVLQKNKEINKKLVTRIVEDFAKKQGKAIGSHVASEYRDYIIAMIKENINPEAKNIMMERGGYEGGWFSIEKNNTWTVGGEEISFSPETTGIHGTTAEALLFGSKANIESGADLTGLMPKAMNYMSRELSLMEIKAKTVEKYGTLTAGTHVTKYITSIKEHVAKDGKKLELRLKPEIDSFMSSVFGVLKLLEKMTNVLVVGTEFKKKSKAWTIFKYVSLTLHTGLNIEEIMKGFKKDGGKHFFNVSADLMEHNPKVLGNKKYEFGSVRLVINVNMHSNIKGIGKGDKVNAFSLYKEHTDLFTDDSSRRGFFEAMYELEKRQKLVAINKDAQQIRKR